MIHSATQYLRIVQTKRELRRLVTSSLLLVKCINWTFLGAFFYTFFLQVFFASLAGFTVCSSIFISIKNMLNNFAENAESSATY